MELRVRIIAEGIEEATADKHFEVLLHILHFKTKQTFYTSKVLSLLLFFPPFSLSFQRLYPTPFLFFFEGLSSLKARKVPSFSFWSV